MRRIAASALLLALMLVTMGSSTIFIKKKAAGDPCASWSGTSSVVMYSNWENGGPQTGDYTPDIYNASTNPDGIDFYSGTDTIWDDVEFVGTVATATSAALADSYGIELSGSATPRAWFRITDESSVPTAAGRFGFLINFDDATGTSATILGCGTGNDWRLSLNGLGQFVCVVEGQGVTKTDLTVATGTDYFIECKYSSSGGYVEMRVNGGSWTAYSGVVSSVGCPSDIGIGNYTAGGYDYDLDLTFFGDDPDVDFYTHLITNGCTDYSGWQ